MLASQRNDPMTLIGTLDQGSLATVDRSGQILSERFGGLRWWVAADDRWHVPPDEPTCRQQRLDGAPVVETMLRVPSGDVVHRAYAVADRGGLIIVEMENRSTLPVAVALDRADVLTGRPPTSVPIQGIELPSNAIVLPIGKGSVVRVALGAGRGGLPPGSAAASSVANGWLSVIDHSPTLALPDDAIRLGVLADRAELLLGPTPSVDDDPKAFLLSVREHARCRLPPERWVDDVVRAAVAVAKSCASGATNESDMALRGAAEVLLRAKQPLAAADIGRMRRRLGSMTDVEPGTAVALRLSHTLDGLARSADEDGIVLLDRLVPAEWYGQSIEVHDAPLENGVVSYAVRWHGDRPALLWESSLDTTVRCPGLDPAWTGSGRRGEALLAAPSDATPTARG